MCYGLVKKQVSVSLLVTVVCGGNFKILLVEPSNPQHRNISWQTIACHADSR